ncbi:hypothetical protein V8B97DRAFT_2010080 [Scleroderma yunnanense]
MSSSPEESPAIAAVKELFNQTLRVSTTDNRVFLGTFVGTDQQLNLLFVNTEEFILRQPFDPNGRYVGQVMIPWRMIKQVEANECNADGGSLYI